MMARSAEGETVECWNSVNLDKVHSHDHPATLEWWLRYNCCDNMNLNMRSLPDGDRQLERFRACITVKASKDSGLRAGVSFTGIRL